MLQARTREYLLPSNYFGEWEREKAIFDVFLLLPRDDQDLFRTAVALLDVALFAREHCGLAEALPMARVTT